MRKPEWWEWFIIGSLFTIFFLMAWLWWSEPTRRPVPPDLTPDVRLPNYGSDPADFKAGWVEDFSPRGFITGGETVLVKLVDDTHRSQPWRTLWPNDQRSCVVFDGAKVNSARLLERLNTAGCRVWCTLHPVPELYGVSFRAEFETR